MHIDLARSLCVRLRGLYPLMTPEQGQFLLTEFLIHDDAIVGRCIDDYAAFQQHLSPAVLLDRIRRESAARQAGRVRVEAAKDAAGRAAAKAEEQRRVDETHAHNDAVCAGLTDACLAVWKARVMDAVRPESREFLAGRDPRTSPTLKSLIVEAIDAEAATDGRAGVVA
jgi:hypothetical protein